MKNNTAAYQAFYDSWTSEHGAPPSERSTGRLAAMSEASLQPGRAVDYFLYRLEEISLGRSFVSSIMNG